jgi:prevent-host-death family protein
MMSREFHPMSREPQAVPITDLRRNAAAVLSRVRKRKKPLIITQNGRAAAVMLSPEAYERREREQRVLLALISGEQEIAAGQGQDLKSVLAEADTLLGKRGRVASRR